jgi:hypothetical protein
MKLIKKDGVKKEIKIMETINYKGYDINIDYDEIAESPMEWDNLGTMVCWHNRYSLGDEKAHENYVYSKECKIKNLTDYCDNWDEVEEVLKKEFNTLVILPLFLYDHSGISMRTYRHGQHSSWDGGWVGFIFVEKDKVKKEWNVKRVSAKLKKKIEEILSSEVNTYDDYIQGNVYHYSVEDKHGNDIDSCGGFYGYDHEKSGLLSEAKSTIDWYIKKEINKKQTRLKTLIKNKVELQYR